MSLFDKWWDAANSNDRAQMAELLHDDFIFVRHNTGEKLSKDEFLDYMLLKWCSMADAQQQQLVTLFGSVDDGDGQLSLTEFMHIVEEVTPAASQAEVLELVWIQTSQVAHDSISSSKCE